MLPAEAPLEFHVADLAFPPGFDPAAHASPQAKRSAWGYQHMSRFWLRGVLLHPAVARRAFLLRLDTDSRFTSPVLDLFQDARARALLYAYRQAGKDWRGRSAGLWDLHCRFMAARSGPNGTHPEGGAPGALAAAAVRAGVGDSTESPAFYTNFEARRPAPPPRRPAARRVQGRAHGRLRGEQLIDVEAFRAGALWAYVEAVDASHGVYARGWGDAQIRWLQVPPPPLPSPPSY